jgi:4-amino-4-deoxy-L-arabinose transferase-like glycosyltransferase
LDVATLAALSYGWGMNQAQLEPFYGAAARSMSQNWHNFIFGAFDPWGTVSVDKLPGALWLQALSLRVFGFHVWAIVLPQVAEGTLTVLVLYRAVRRVTGAGAGLASAVVMTTSPIVLLLDHGNISDSLLILLLVLAADATTRAFSSGRARYLLWAGLWVGLAFQTKMIQAWLVLPALYLAYLVVSPVTRLWRRLLHVALSTIVVAVISLSWMTAVSIVPAADRPYVDGSCDNSLYSQVFEYNGLERLEGNLLSQPGCFKTSPYVVALYRTSAAQGINTGSIGPAWDRLLKGVFGHDDAWLLFPAAVSAVGLALRRRRKPRTDPVRAALLLWSAWFLIDFAFFSAGTFINSYYVAALIPAVAALCGMGAVGAWRHRSAGTVRIVLAATTVGSVATTVALIPDYVGLRNWIIGSTVVVGTVSVAILLGSLRRGRDSVWSTTVGPIVAVVAMLAGSTWASGIVFSEGIGPFNAPYQPEYLNRITQGSIAKFNQGLHILPTFTDNVPPSVAADVIETSGFAGNDILATGREFLSVGGFTGRVPAPPLSEFVRFVAAGRINRATLATKPLTRNPDLLWVRAHCQGESSYPLQGTTITFSVYNCRPADVSRASYPSNPGPDRAHHVGTPRRVISPPSPARPVP